MDAILTRGSNSCTRPYQEAAESQNSIFKYHMRYRKSLLIGSIRPKPRLLWPSDISNTVEP